MFDFIKNNVFEKKNQALLYSVLMLPFFSQSDFTYSHIVI